MTDDVNSNPNQPNEKPLESWKEIAVYLQRDVRTVRRWEKDEALPVRRHLHQARSSVYAYASELEAWKAARQPGFDQAPLAMPWRRPLPALGLTLALLLALVSVASGPILTTPGALAQEAGGITARQVWTRSGQEEPQVDLHGAVSPDGRHLSFVNWKTGNLALRDLSAGSFRDVTDEGTWTGESHYAWSSVWSPHGKQLAYTWYNCPEPCTPAKHIYEMRVVGADGSNMRVLYRNPEVDWTEPKAWSPDGRYILTLFGRTDRVWQAALVSASDGSARILKTFDWRRPAGMSLSPDGRFIVYDFPTGEDSPLRDIYLLAVDGSREAVLVQHSANDSSPIWTPDEERVLFRSDRTGQPGLWSLRVLDGKAQGAPVLVKQGGGRPLGFGPGGAYYYGTGSGTRNIYSANFDAERGRVTSVPKVAIERYEGFNSAPEFSPDGKYLAYLSGRSPGFASAGSVFLTVVIREVETGVERDFFPRLMFSTLHRRFRWSPDGRWLLAAAKDIKGNRGAFRIDVQTGAVEQVVHNPESWWPPLWARDGKEVYFRRILENGDRPLSAVNLQTGQVRDIYPAASRSMDVSPDGRWIVVRGHPSKNLTTLKLVPVNGGSPRTLLGKGLSNVEIMPLTWTPDGRYVVFAKTNPETRKRELWRVSVEGGEVEEVGLSFLGLIRDVRFSPDGRHLFFEGNGPAAREIWVLENFLPKLETKAARLEE